MACHFVEIFRDCFHVTSSKLKNLNYKSYKACRFTYFVDFCCEFWSKILDDATILSSVTEL